MSKTPTHHPSYVKPREGDQLDAFPGLKSAGPPVKLRTIPVGVSTRAASNPIDPVVDAPRLGKQLEAVRALMRDGHWRTLETIAQLVNGSEAGVSARLRDMRKEAHGAWLVEKRRTADNSGLWEYSAHPPRGAL